MGTIATRIKSVLSIIAQMKRSRLRRVSIATTSQKEVMVGVFSYTENPAVSDLAFGFERKIVMNGSATIAPIFDDTPSLKRFSQWHFRKLKYLETESLFDFPFNGGFQRVMLIRDNMLFRLMAWGSDGFERYKLYTREWKQFRKSVERVTGGKLVPTDKLWSGGYIVNVVGPDIHSPLTPLTDDFENEILRIVRNKFDEVIDSKVYGFVESELYVAKANIEETIDTLHNAVRRFTPSASDFESQFVNEVGISDFEI